MAEKAKTCSTGNIINSLVIHARVPFWLHYLMKLVYIIKMYYENRKKNILPDIPEAQEGMSGEIHAML